MRRRLVVRTSLLPLMLALYASSATAQGTGGTVSGQVSDSLSRTPLSGAEVLLGDVGAANVRSTRTTAEGRYTFSNVPAGLTTVGHPPAPPDPTGLLRASQVRTV